MIIQLVLLVVLLFGWTFYRSQIILARNQPALAVVYCCLMGICMVFGSLLIAHVNIPSTTILVRVIFEPIGKIILQH